MEDTEGKMQIASISNTTTTTTTTNDPSSTTNIKNLDDQRYYFNTEQLQQFKTNAPWMKDPKYFTSIAISPTAIIKIMKHCQSGVEKGISKGGNPIEVMGMLLGRPDPITKHTLIVTDAYPLPIEGFETRVIADDEHVINHMIALGESIEETRYERFMGWYHSHPFDLSIHHSHCYLSQTDLSTQLQWQRAEDVHGNPFVAIVVDPLRSTHYNIPEIKAFRAYPPEYNSLIANECPDGTIEMNEQQRLELWGSCWNRYYELKVEYFCSQISRRLLENVTQDYIWIRTLYNQSDTKLTEQLYISTKEFHTAATTTTTTTTTATTTNIPGTMSSGRTSSGNTATSGGMNRRKTKTGVGTKGVSFGSNQQQQQQQQMDDDPLTVNEDIVTNKRFDELNKAIHHLSDVSLEQHAESTLLEVKKLMFT